MDLVSSLEMLHMAATAPILFVYIGLSLLIVPEYELMIISPCLITRILLHHHVKTLLNPITKRKLKLYLY